MHGLEAEFWGQIDFVYLDIDDPANSEVKDQFGFVAQPLFVLITADGEEVERWSGYVSADEFRVVFDELLAESGG